MTRVQEQRHTGFEGLLHVGARSLTLDGVNLVKGAVRMERASPMTRRSTMSSRDVRKRGLYTHV